MLIVNATGTSSIVVTAGQSAVNKVNPYFTFQLYQKGTNETIVFTANDISTSPNYWNQYILTTATASIGLTQGLIPITEGEWLYKIFEMTNEYDLNLSDAIGQVGMGIMVVGLTFSRASSIMADNSVKANPIPVSSLR